MRETAVQWYSAMTVTIRQTERQNQIINNNNNTYTQSSDVLLGVQTITEDIHSSTLPLSVWPTNTRFRETHNQSTVPYTQHQNRSQTILWCYNRRVEVCFRRCLVIRWLVTYWWTAEDSHSRVICRLCLQLLSIFLSIDDICVLLTPVSVDSVTTVGVWRL